MWFVFGLFTLTLSAWLVFRWRLASRWIGIAARLGDQAYEYAPAQNKGRLTGLRIGIDCATGMHFCLKRENLIDRFFKAIGLSEEQQLDRLHFDERVYVMSDDKRLGMMLRLRPELQSPLAGLFDQQHFADFRINKLWCRDRRLWLEASPARSMSARDFDPAPLAAEVLPVLRRLADTLASSASPLAGSQDHFFLKACLLTAASAALAINGAIQLFRIGVSRFPVMVDHDALWALSVTVGLILLGLLIGACILWLGRTSRSHIVLIELLLVGGFGAMTSSYAELRNLNVGFDGEPIEQIFTRVEHARSFACGKNNRSTCYRLTLAPTRELAAMELQVNGTTYRSLPQGAQVAVPLRAGALGFRWIEEPQRVP